MHAQHDRRELNRGQDEKNDSDHCRQALVPDRVKSLRYLVGRNPVGALESAQLRALASRDDNRRRHGQNEPRADIVNSRSPTGGGGVIRVHLANSREPMCGAMLDKALRPR
jgi:hypothetical protein